jgi:SAM-dependent methyltransferase
VSTSHHGEAWDAQLAQAGLRRGEDGVWYSTASDRISYPADGNAACLQIEDNSFWFRHRNRCIVALAQRFHPAGTLVDIGGGNGYVAAGLLAAGVDCILVEPGADGAKAARRRGVDTVICATLSGAGLPPESLPAAGMFDVLEHIEDEQGALSGVHALLRPGGTLFITVPAYAFLTSEDDREAGHFRRYTVRGLSRALGQAGFEMRYASYMFAPLPLPVFVARTVPSLLGRRRNVVGHAAAEHRPEGMAARVMDRLLDWEFARIAAGRVVPFGTSCIAVATRR